VRQTPHAATRTSNSSSAGDGTATSVSSSGLASTGFGEFNKQAFTVAQFISLDYLSNTSVVNASRNYQRNSTVGKWQFPTRRVCGRISWFN
jgi:hypothetical protein